MADLYLSGGDTLPDDETRPTTRAAGARPWDRHVPVPATAADRGTFWQPVPDEQFPSRMARRRALEAAQLLDGWRPDPMWWLVIMWGLVMFTYFGVNLWVSGLHSYAGV